MGNDLAALTEKFSTYKTLLLLDFDKSCIDVETIKLTFRNVAYGFPAPVPSAPSLTIPAIPPTSHLHDFLDLRSSNPDPDMRGDHAPNLLAQEPPRKSIPTAGLRCVVVVLGSD
uniref:Uncharacterized protein n=1 Tax=Glossina pallidipes TaxID=7398 RepID=A0A1B0A5J2_GLOPL